MEVTMRVRSFASGMTLVLGLVFTTTLALAAGDMGERNRQPGKDSWLTAKTKIALFADDRVKGRQINVETSKGTVTLRGKVDSAEAKMAAEDIAKGIDGVQSVKNDLQVVAPGKRKVTSETDDAITTQVKRQFARDKRLKGADIDVKTNAGVVSLTGEVSDLNLSAEASGAAWRVPGVRSVRNDINIKERG
jgi:hyperosmotically inducible protein